MEKLISILEAARIEKNLSYDEIAVTIGASRSNVWRALTGKTKPSFEMVCKLCEAFGFEFIFRQKPKETDGITEKYGSDSFGITKAGKKKMAKALDHIEAKAKKIIPVSKFEAAIASVADKNKVVAEPNAPECNCVYNGATRNGTPIRVKKCDHCKKLKR